MALTPQQAEELQNLVEQRLEALRTEFGQDLSRMREDRLDQIVGAVPDPGDESVQSLIQDLDQADASRDLSELRMLDAARTRIDDGTYGVCESCGNPIGKLRLQAAPRATLCVPCKTKQERR